MVMANILLLAGGTSSEREVSLRSGAAVTAALETMGHHVTVADPANTISDDEFTDADVIFPVLHGTGGEDGTLQARLEALGLTNFVGANAKASTLCFDKDRYREVVQAAGITIAAGELVSGDVANHPLAQKPFVLKPYNGGSSVDTFIIRDPNQADFVAMDAACARYGNMLIEALIEGVEITVGVLGDGALPVVEIIPPTGGEFDYENKYNGQTQELCPPKHVAESVQIRAQALALQIHSLTGCRDLSRTDMIVTADDELYVLETNTLPGMTNESLLPKAAAAAGITMPKLCNRLVNFAFARANA